MALVIRWDSKINPPSYPPTWMTPSLWPLQVLTEVPTDAKGRKGEAKHPGNVPKNTSASAGLHLVSAQRHCQLNFAVEVWDILLFWEMACDATDHIKEKTLVRAMTWAIGCAERAGGGGTSSQHYIPVAAFCDVPMQPGACREKSFSMKYQSVLTESWHSPATSTKWQECDVLCLQPCSCNRGCWRDGSQHTWTHNGTEQVLQLLPLSFK